MANPHPHAALDNTPPAAAGASRCFHCDEPVPGGVDLGVVIDGAERPMCCRGCQAVAQTIVTAGLADYYRFRTGKAVTAAEPVPDFLKDLDVYDEPEVARQFVKPAAGDLREATLVIEGIACPACVWVNERYLQRLPGVQAAQVNYSTRRARVRYDGRRLHLSDLLKAVHGLGYKAYPYDPQRQQQVAERERSLLLRQLGVAAVFGMQVMMVALALYVGGADLDAEHRRLLNGLNLLLTAPVVVYSAQAFFRPAWRGLIRATPGMDVSVSLGILLAFFGSAWATLVDRGEVYYDSVTMFVLLLLAARYFELMARKRATEAGEDLARQQPATAVRLIEAAGGYRQERVPVARLRAGDRVLIRAGETVPADGVVVEGASTVDESLLTGESLPVTKGVDAEVIGGSTNIDSPLQVEVRKVGDATVLAGILHALENAQAERPPITLFADRIAGWFVLVVLSVATGVGGYGWANGDPLWFEKVLAILVITCPCALSLATPAAVVSAIGALTRQGVLVVHGKALETLARATCFVFDKTGTLTRGRPRVMAIERYSSLSEEDCLRVAAALERQSEHPIAAAILDAADGLAPATASDVVNRPGEGMEGGCDGQHWFLGTAAFVWSRIVSRGDATLAARLRGEDNTLVLLADAQTVHCAFRLDDELRSGAAAAVADLKALGRRTLLLTGDHEAAARRVAARVGIDEVRANLRPQAKLDAVRALQQGGAVVAMVGDGINDAPALARSQVSVAMGTGANITRANADLILLGERLESLSGIVRHARRTLGVIRENLAWAAVYNLVALPVAALGYVSPWLAALGMSLSSLLVVANALRLSRVAPAEVS